MTSLPDAIRSLSHTFAAETGLTPVGINSGLCADFADALTKNFGMGTMVVGIDDLFDEFGELALFSTAAPGIDWDCLERIGAPSELSHSWILFDGRHYDAEAPDGVGNPFDLACIRHGLHELMELRDQQRLDDLTETYEWWRETAQLRREREALLPIVDAGYPMA